MTTDAKLDKILDRLNTLHVVVMRQEQSLNDFARRTNLLEKQLPPILVHVARVKFLGAIMTVLLGVSGVLVAYFHR